MLWHPGRDFVVAPFIGQNKDEDQTKKSPSLQNELVFSPKVYDDQKKSNRSLPTNQWVFGLKRKKTTNGVTPKW